MLANLQRFANIKQIKHDMKKLAIGMDIGGTNIEAGLVNGAGKLLKSVSAPARFISDTKNIQAGIIDLANRFKLPGVAGVGIGCPGRGRLSHAYQKESNRSPRLRSGQAKNPPTTIIFSELNKNKAKLEKEIKLPIKLENDANCFVLGESLYGAGKKYDIVVSITLGTGIGFGLTNNKQLQREGGLAKEFGHMIINFQDKDVYCQCQNKGCWEGYIGKRGIIRMAKKHGLKINEPKDLFRPAQQNNSKAKKTWQEMGLILGIGLSNIINGLSPEIIIIGGQIAKSWKFFYKSMYNEVKSRSMIAPCPIVKSRLRNAAILGAASLVLK